MLTINAITQVEILYVNWGAAVCNGNNTEYFFAMLHKTNNLTLNQQNEFLPTARQGIYQHKLPNIAAYYSHHWLSDKNMNAFFI